MPFISVITVNLNNAAGLEKTISSVINQTYVDFEFIIIDGGSTDGSVDVLKRNEKSISKWISEKDNGIFNAQNKGIERASGNYCIFLNSGDYLVDENVLEKFSGLANGSDIFYGDMYIDNGDGKLVYKRSSPKISIKKMLTDTLWHPVSFISRDLFAKFGNYNEKFRIVSDYEFFVRVIIFHKVKTQYINHPVAVFNATGISSDMKFRRQLEEERMVVQDMYFNPVLLKLFRFYGKLRN